MHIHCSYQLLSLYETISLNYYGIFIALGIVISFYFLTQNPLFKAVTDHPHFTTLINAAICAGVIGGRLVTVITEYTPQQTVADWFNLSQGGFSALGSIAGVIVAAPFFLHYYSMPILPMFDAVALYAPLFQSIARIGCFIVGCCHGIPTNSIFSVTYTHPDTLAVCSHAVHPTQLYSSTLLFMIFLLLKSSARPLHKIPGALFTLYLACASLERFFVDFWRADRIIIYALGLSVHQCIALFLLSLSGMLSLYLLSPYFSKRHESI
jgi:phosphatidylglycerol:prolipoprotein diacylglycerol transferase